MISALALLVLAQGNGLWKPLTEEAVRLIDVEGSSGPAVVLADKSVVAFDANGKEVKRLKPPPGSTPLFLGAEGLEFAESSKQARIIYSQFGNEIRIGLGAVVYSKQATFSLPKVDNWSAVGVSRDGANIVAMTRPMSAPILKQFRFNDQEWVAQGEIITPEVEGVGLATVFPRYNDLRVVDANRVLFIGGLWSSQEMTDASAATLESRLENKGVVLPLEETGRREAFAYLFMTNLRSRVTTPVVKLSLNGSGESGSYRAGRVSVSDDGKWAYLLCKGGIGRVAIP